jgi:uncharacterized protein YtpQ (UPF0354 family)
MVTRLCGALVVVALAACLSAQAQEVPKQDLPKRDLPKQDLPKQVVPKGEAAFTEYVATQMRRAIGGGATVVVESPLTLAVGELQANLDRIFIFCNRSPSRCANEVSSYVKGVVQVLKERSAPLSKEAVRVVVRTKAYVTETQSLPKAPKLQPRPLAGELVMLPAIDTPRMIRMLNEEDNQGLGLSADDVFALGLANLRQHLKPLMSVAKVAQAGQIGRLSGDAYQSSRLALFEPWSALAKAHGGRLIVASPATDTVLYIGDDSPTAIEALRLLVKNVSSRTPSPLSSELFRFTAARWELVR